MDGRFSLALGLVDYLNVIAYACFCIVIVKFYRAKMNKSQFIMFVIGMVTSLVFAFGIPTYKVINALGLVEFIIPEFIVFFVGVGFFLSGLALFLSTCKSKGKAAIALAFGEAPSSFNFVAVALCVAGMMLNYVSIIKLSLQKKLKLPIILICFAIVCAIGLPLIATNFDVFSEWVHWIVEISNIACQVFLLISTIMVVK